MAVPTAVLPVLKFSEKLFLLGLIQETVTTNGGDWTKYTALATTAMTSNAAVDWQALLSAIIADLPQILTFITALATLFGA